MGARSLEGGLLEESPKSQRRLCLCLPVVFLDIFKKIPSYQYYCHRRGSASFGSKYVYSITVGDDINVSIVRNSTFIGDDHRICKRTEFIGEQP